MQQTKKHPVPKLIATSAFAGMVLSAPTLGHAQLGDQTLRKGHSNQDVKELQHELKDKGLFHYKKATGYFGTITQKAVKDFQRKHGMKVTGVANRKVYQKMGVVHSKTKNKSIKVTSKRLLRIGSRGQAVSDLQSVLKKEDYYKGNIDGIFGAKSRSAVRSFQQDQHLQVDGIAGPKTFKALNGSSGSSKTNKKHHSSVKSKSKTHAKKHNGLLKVGNRDSKVTTLQKTLKKAGTFHQSASGYFGTATDKAVQRFQRKHNLSVDGIVGPKTNAELDQVGKSGGSTSHSSTPPSSSSHSSSSKHASADSMNIIADATQLTGTPYQWGGTTPAGFDCSGYIQYVFKKNGIQLPRTVAQMWNSGQGQKLSKSQLKPGDIVFYQNTYEGANGPSHNGIYVGHGEFIQSGSKGVKTTKMSYSAWSNHYLGAKRFN